MRHPLVLITELNFAAETACFSSRPIAQQTKYWINPNLSLEELQIIFKIWQLIQRVYKKMSQAITVLYLNRLTATRIKNLEVKTEYKVFEIPHKLNFKTNPQIKQSINLKAATCITQTTIKIQKMLQWIIMDQKERILSSLMNRMYNKSIKLLIIKIHQIRILKFNKSKNNQIIKKKRIVDKIKGKFNFINLHKTICM